MAKHDGDAAWAKRILLANTARTDIVNVTSRICCKRNDGWSCLEDRRSSKTLRRLRTSLPAA
jgi:hypothetical protein